MLRILIPTDCSHGAANALRYALQLTREFDAELTLMQCNVIPLHTAEMPVVTEMPDADELITKMKEETEAITAELKWNSDNKIYYTIASGLSLEAVIEEVVEEIKADLVIMGTHGAGGMKKVLMGSNTVRAIETVRIPILIVPQQYDFVQPRAILMPSDLKLLREELSDAAPFAQLMGATLEVLFFSDATEKAMKCYDEAMQLVEANSYDKIKVSLENMRFGKSIAEDIELAVKDKKPDMLIMFRHEHNWLGNLFLTSQTDQVAFATKIPLLAFHEPKKK